MESPDRPRNPYELAADRMRERDRGEAKAHAAAPLGPFLLRQLLWALAGAVLGFVMGGWVWAVVMFVGWGSAGLLVRWWIKRRYSDGPARPSTDR